MNSTKFTFIFIAFTSATKVIGFQSRTGLCPDVHPMKNFDMSRFLGLWNVVQGTSTGRQLECITFNISQMRNHSNRYVIRQLPHNLASELIADDPAMPGNMSIQYSPNSNGARFIIATTNYDEFALFFICENDYNQHQRAAAVLSRTKWINKDQHQLVKKLLRDYKIYDSDLTDMLECPMKGNK